LASLLFTGKTPRLLLWYILFDASEDVDDEVEEGGEFKIDCLFKSLANMSNELGMGAKPKFKTG